jgi:replicative DNA helicase
MTTQLDAATVKSAITLEAVVQAYVQLKQRGREMFGHCPTAIHGKQDRTPSLTVTPDAQLWKCFGCGAGGDVFDFVKAVEGVTFSQAVDIVAEFAGLAGSGTGRKAAGEKSPEPAPANPANSPRGPMVKAYDYVDEAGNLLYQACRYEPGANGRSKDFAFRQPAGDGWIWNLQNVRKVPYRLPRVIESDVVYVTEGEKDAESIEALGFTATTNCGGANGEWTPEMVEALRGKRVIVVPDQDQPGIVRGKKLAVAFAAVAESVIIVNVPDGKDVTDYLASHPPEEWDALVKASTDQQLADLWKQRGLLSAAEIGQSIRGGVAAFLDPTLREPGLSTGFRKLDKITGGLQRGEVVVLAARPAMGKTALALNIAVNVARAGFTVPVFSLEMSASSLLTRTMCSEARINQMQFRDRALGVNERTRLRSSFLGLCEMPLHIDDEPGARIDRIESKTRALMERSSKPLGMVVIDYLQLMGTEDKGSRTQEVGANSRAIKVLAKQLDVPFLVLSQLSRSAETRPGDHRPQLSDLRDSGEIEQDADVVMFIYREEVYKQDREDLRGVADLIIAKQRNGPIGKVPLVFLNQYTRFENRADDGEAAA